MQLTAREQQVYRMLGRGRTYAQMAADLGISIKTVDAHLAHIAAKAGVTRREARILAAREVAA